MLAWSINLFRVRGIQLAVHSSFILLLVYYGWAGYQIGGSTGVFWSTLTLVLFFTCVVLHELGHSFTARRFGIGVRRILLMPIGGMAEFDSIPRQPRREFLITIAGPAVNFAIVAILWPLVDLPTSDSPPIPLSFSDVASYLLAANLVMGVFNLAPVFPMDGGRILRAILATRLPYIRATYWASRIGKILAVVGLAVGLWFHLYILAALFAFIFFAGDAEYRSLLRREREDAHWRAMMEQYYPLRPAPSSPEEPPLLRR